MSLDAAPLNSVCGHLICFTAYSNESNKYILERDLRVPFVG